MKDGEASSKTIRKELVLKALSKWLLPRAVWAREEKRAAADVLWLHAMSGDLGRTEQADIWGTSSVICSERPLFSRVNSQVAEQPVKIAGGGSRPAEGAPEGAEPYGRRARPGSGARGERGATRCCGVRRSGWCACVSVGIAQTYRDWNRSYVAMIRLGVNHCRDDKVISKHLFYQATHINF